MVPSLEEQVSALIIEARNLTDATKKRIHVFTLVIAVFLIALVGFGTTALRANSAAMKAQKALAATCEAGNDFRRQDLALWNHVLDISSGGPQTAEEKKRVRQFRAFLAEHDKLRVCKP